MNYVCLSKMKYLDLVQYGQQCRLHSGEWHCFKANFSCSLCKVKEPRKRPGVAQRVPGGLGSQVSWHSAREGGGVVSLTYRSPLPPGMFLVFIFTRGWVDPRAMVRSEGIMSLKNPVTPPGIDPGTLRLVAQRLNHYATPGLPSGYQELFPRV